MGGALIAFAAVSRACSGSGDPFPGSNADDAVMNETGAWGSDLQAPQTAFYVRPPSGAYGAGDGSSWENAFSGLPEQRVRGARYYFAAGDYFDESLGRIENYVLDDPESGEEFIWLTKATATDHGDDAGFEDELADGPAELGPLSFVTGRYVIDGREGSGTEGYGFHIYHRDCGTRETEFVASPIFFPWDSVTEYVLIRKAEIEDCGNHDDPTVISQDAVYAVAGPSHLIITGCYLHDAWRNMIFLQDSLDVMIEDNRIARAGLHHEASTMSFRNTRNVVVRRNRITDSVNCYVSLQGVRNVTIASNVMTRTLDDWDDWSGVFSQEPALNVLIAGNTFFDLEGLNTGIRFTGETENLRVVNNLWARNRTNQIMLDGEHRSNAFWDNLRVDGDEPVSLDGAIEEEGVQVLGTDPFVDCDAGDLHLSFATDPGEDLDDPFTLEDLDGVTRGADGVIDRGAYEFASD
jgi:hypothetical protein